MGRYDKVGAQKLSLLVKLYAGTTEQFQADTRMHRIAEKAMLTGHCPTSTGNAVVVDPAQRTSSGPTAQMPPRSALELNEAQAMA